MYMAEKSVKSAVLTKVNEIMNWHAKSIADLQMRTRDYDFSIENRKKVSAVIDDIKVLDPAVGSGHFLVSRLNELKVR